MAGGEDTESRRGCDIARIPDQPDELRSRVALECGLDVVDHEGALAAPAPLGAGQEVLVVDGRRDAEQIIGLGHHPRCIDLDLPGVDVYLQEPQHVPDQALAWSFLGQIPVAVREVREVAHDVRWMRDVDAGVGIEDHPEQVGA